MEEILMMDLNRDTAIKKIMEMPKEQVVKVLIFMAGMEAEHMIKNQMEVKKEPEAEQAVV